MKAIVVESENANTSNICKFDRAAWQKVIKIVGCCNQDSFNFMIHCIQNISSDFPGIQLDTMPAEDLPLRTIAHLWIPPPVPQDKSVLSFLHMQNTDLKSWQLLESKKWRENEEGGKEYKFMVDKELTKKIEIMEGAIKFGLGNLRVNMADVWRGINQKDTGGLN